MLRMPFLLGYDYFMWVDEPALGISSKFPENTNYGLVNEENEPYPEIVAALTDVHRNAARLRREGLAKLPPPKRPLEPPKGPAGTEIVLWNNSPLNLPAAPVWIPAAPSTRALQLFDGKKWRTIPTQIAPRPSRAPAAVVHVGPARPGQALFLRSAKQAPQTAAHPGLRVDWRPGARAFRVDAGAFQLAGGLGANRLVQKVAHRGLPLGSYTAMLHVMTNRNEWVDVAQTTDVRITAGPLAAVLDLTGRTESDRYAFEITHRLTVFPGADWFVAELISVRNLGAKPLHVKGFFFRFYSAIGGDAANDAATHVGIVPRLWGSAPRDAWWDAKIGAYWGCLSPLRDPMRVYFWLDPQGGQHPDARWIVDMTVAPGQTYRPARPIFVIALAGRGGTKAWDAQAHRVHAIAALPVQ